MGKTAMGWTVHASQGGSGLVVTASGMSITGALLALVLPCPLFA